MYEALQSTHQACLEEVETRSGSVGLRTTSVAMIHHSAQDCRLQAREMFRVNLESASTCVVLQHCSWPQAIQPCCRHPRQCPESCTVPLPGSHSRQPLQRPTLTKEAERSTTPSSADMLHLAKLHFEKLHCLSEHFKLSCVLHTEFVGISKLSCTCGSRDMTAAALSNVLLSCPGQHQARARHQTHGLWAKTARTRPFRHRRYLEASPAKNKMTLQDDWAVYSMYAEGTVMLGCYFCRQDLPRRAPPSAVAELV